MNPRARSFVRAAALVGIGALALACSSERPDDGESVGQALKADAAPPKQGSACGLYAIWKDGICGYDCRPLVDGSRCADEHVCVAGHCRPQCEYDFQCGPGGVCRSGGCATSCSGDDDCLGDQECVGGVCKKRYVCRGSYVDCGGSCVHLRDDASNCGACGHQCGPGQTCYEGACQCPMGSVFCDGRCVQSDENNCNACGVTCAQGEVCYPSGCAWGPR